VRWKYGVPPSGNANYAWVQHFIHHLAPNGYAGFVLANGSMSSNQSGEGEIRQAIVEADLVDCMVALPGQLFYSTPIPACLWFLARNKSHSKKTERRRQTLFIDARAMGAVLERKYRIFSDEDISRIVQTYHAWCGRGEAYEDVPGLCYSASTEEIASQGYSLTPGRYVGTLAADVEDEPFAEAMTRLVAQWRHQQAESRSLDQRIDEMLRRLCSDDR
jgi:type I restriction enzyme M protein